MGLLVVIYLRFIFPVIDSLTISLSLSDWVICLGVH